jgi:hypothetical protein
MPLDFAPRCAYYPFRSTKISSGLLGNGMRDVEYLIDHWNYLRVGKSLPVGSLGGLRLASFEKKEGLPMCSKTRFFVVASILVFIGLGITTVQAAEQKKTTGQKQTTSRQKVQNQWRYTFHNSEWWYWLPTARWVYWRNNQWNAYNPKTYVAPNSAGVVASTRSGTTSGSRAFDDLDVRPFYGHAESNLDRRSLQMNEEVGPFYDHALPSEVFDGWRSRGSNQPFYGHAGSTNGD